VVFLLLLWPLGVVLLISYFVAAGFRRYL
jgi:hypothetical protein